MEQDRESNRLISQALRGLNLISHMQSKLTVQAERMNTSSPTLRAKFCDQFDSLFGDLP